MYHLTNPYSRSPVPTSPWRHRRAVLAGGALAGAVVVAGCSTGTEAPVQPPPIPVDPPAANPPVTNPLAADPPAADPPETDLPAPTPRNPTPPAATPGDAAASPPPTPSPAVAGTPDRPTVPRERPRGPVQLNKPGADYRVGRGDSLSHIAAAFDVVGGWRGVWARNCDVLYDPDFIVPGQELDLDGPAVPGCS